MSDRRVGPLLSLVRQGLELEVDFGTHSIEALLWIAETVEESVYPSGSLASTPAGLRFELLNPPLRVGAFHALRVSVDDRWVPPEGVRFRPALTATWRSAASLSAESPVVLAPGRPMEFAVDAPWARDPGERHLRVELESVAIPPLVWIEFADTARAESPP